MFEIKIVIYKRCALNIYPTWWYLWPQHREDHDHHRKDEIWVEKQDARNKGFTAWRHDWSDVQQFHRYSTIKHTVCWLCFQLSFIWWHKTWWGRNFEKGYTSPCLKPINS